VQPNVHLRRLLQTLRLGTPVKPKEAVLSRLKALGLAAAATGYLARLQCSLQGALLVQCLVEARTAAAAVLGAAQHPSLEAAADPAAGYPGRAKRGVDQPLESTVLLDI
jgi:hypothetical protein